MYAVYAKDISQDLADREIDAETIGIQIDKDFKTTRIYDRTGQVLLYEIIPDNGGRRVQVPLSSIPEYLRNATIAMEDKTFYTNPAGINIEGVARAIWGELRGVNAGGGSSISQQLIRNVIMTPEERFERSYVRKVKEVILSYQLTQKYPGVEGRDKILEWYLNTIFYGHFAYGVEAAAQTYFNKPVQDLTLAEAAMLVPCGQSPALNPIDAPEEAKKRQEIVLDEMYLQGYITAEEAWEAKQETLVIAPPRFDMVAPHYVLYVRDMLEKRFGTEAVYGGGLQVITAIDLEVQAKAEEIARARIAEMREPHNAHNAAITVLDTKTGELLAMVGSLDYHDESIDGQVNMALSPLQPGSSFKPFTYATALAQGFTPATMIMDVRTSFPDPPNPVPYVPENFSRNYHGPLLLRQALACSYNIPAVAVAHKVGIDNVVRTARAMGITTLDASSYGLSLTLGGYPVTVLDMAYGFSVFANGGTMVGQTRPASLIEPGERRLDPVAILQVTDANGNPLDYGQREVQPVIRPEVAFLITDILSDNQARTQAFGANSKLVLKDRPAAVKTGTTNDFYDGWTVGYTPQYTVGVWVGNTNHEKMKNADGSRVAAPIWNDLMVWLHDGLPVEGFARPAGIETAIVDSVSGKLPTAYSGGRIQEVFMKDGGMPTETDDVHFPFRICNATGKLATVHCPADQVETKVFSIFPPEADNWVREQGIPQPPNDYCDVHGPNLANTDVSITSPKAMSGVNGIVSIMGNARAGGQEKYWLEYGPGMNPGVWYPIGPEHGHQVENDLLETWDTRSL
ncbi:MAG: penicillin-binding protein, partial [Chloroflexi bacterium]|nr:penicillin-binding protein [Chloroflexota bacterium]